MLMTQVIDFIFDFASPNAYLADKALAGVSARTGSSVNYIPCLLGGIFKATGNQAPFIAFGGIKGKLDYERLEMQRFIQKHGLSSFRMNPHFPVSSLLLQRGAIAAKRDGYLEGYIKAGLAHMWEQGLNMSDPEVYAAAMSEAGFDGQALLLATQDPAIKQALIDNTETAVARGCFGVPTFYAGDEMFFGKDRLGQLEECLS